MKEDSILKIEEDIKRNIDVIVERGNVSLVKHEFEYVGFNNVHKCKKCGLEIPIGDMRVFEAAQAKKLAEVLDILDKNNFHEWKPQEVKDFNTLANGGTYSLRTHTTLVSTERVEAAYNEIRYGRVCKPYGLRR